MILPADNEQRWIAQVGEVRGERLAGRAAVLDFIGRYFADAPREVLFAVYLDRDLTICDIVSLGRGSVDGVQVRIAEVLRQGTAVNAVGFLLVHNQPRGNPAPSQLDVGITRRIRQITEELDMPLLDHFIVAGSEITTLADGPA